MDDRHAVYVACMKRVVILTLCILALAAAPAEAKPRPLAVGTAHKLALRWADEVWGADASQAVCVRHLSSSVACRVTMAIGSSDFGAGVLRVHIVIRRGVRIVLEHATEAYRY